MNYIDFTAAAANTNYAYLLEILLLLKNNWAVIL